MYLGHPNYYTSENVLKFCISSLDLEYYTLPTEPNPFECTIRVKKANQAEAEGCLHGENCMRVHCHTPGAH